MNQRIAGFTIVELLVVVVVVGVLATIGVISFRNVQQHARDSRRMADISSMNKAILLYVADNGHAPYLADSPYCRVEMGPDSCWVNEMDDGGGYSTWAGLGTELGKYYGYKPLPKDPCGIKCYDEDQDLFFAYRYNSPGSFDPGEALNEGLPTNSTYTIYAEALESNHDQYGFGFGSF